MNEEMREPLVREMIKAGAMAIVRLPSGEGVMPLVRALLDGGVNLLEVSLNTPGACGLIREIGQQFGQAVLIGAGTVTSEEEATQALDAGAQYIVSPVTDPELVSVAHARGAPVCMGAFTATEMLLAHRGGADIIKIFPAEGLGPKYIKALKDPFPGVRLMPTGGVSPGNAGEWIRHGADLLGVGGALCDRAVIAAGDFAIITERAKELMRNIKEARGN